MTSLRGVVWVAVVASLASGLLSCNGASPAAELRPDDIQYKEVIGDKTGPCIEGNRFPRVMVVDWRPERRTELEVMMKLGLAVVAYDCQGLRILPQCKVEGDYGFVGVTLKEEVIRLDNADEVRANLPLTGGGLAVELGGEFARGTALDIGLALIGKRTAPRSRIGRGELKGECSGATHFVRGASIGAFAMKTGSSARVAATVEVFSFETGGASSSDKEVQNRDGSLEACRDADPDSDKAPTQCSALVQVDLAAIDASVPVDEVEIASAVCPRGYALSGQKCVSQDGAQAYQCKMGDASGCFDQCDREDLGSCATLAAMFATGQGVPRNPARAQKLADKACAGGNGPACVWAGRVPYDAEKFDEAAENFTTACDQGIALGCRFLATMHQRGAGVARDSKRATALFERACKGGDEASCATLERGSAIWVGDADKDRRAFEKTRRACDTGNKRSCAELAAMHARGIGTEADPVRSYAMLGQQCEQKQNLHACVQMAHDLIFGIGTEARRKAGLQMFHELCKNAKKLAPTAEEADALCKARYAATAFAADVLKHDSTREVVEVACRFYDSPHGCYVVGRAALNGWFEAPDPKRARAHFQTSCIRGFPPSCGRLARLAEADAGDDADKLAALRKLYEVACHERGKVGCGFLGDMHRAGKGVPRDFDKALALYNKGCLSKVRPPYNLDPIDDHACFVLGSLHESGEGVEKSPEKAMDMYLKACGRYHGPACLEAARISPSIVIEDEKESRKKHREPDNLKARACTLGVKSACP